MVIHLVPTLLGAGEPGQPATLNPDSANRQKERDTVDSVNTDYTHRGDSLAPTTSE